MKNVLLLASCALAFAGACSSSDDPASPGQPPTNAPDAGTGDVTNPPADSGTAPKPPVPMAPEVLSFFDAFHGSRYSESTAKATVLDDAVEAGRFDGEIALVRGLSHLWHLSEAGRDSNPDAALLQSEAMSLVDWFTFAQEKQPNDARVGCFLGTSLVGAGEQTKNQALVEQGFAVLDQAAKAYPEFNLFCVALAYDGYPVSDPGFDKAVDALWQTLDVCFGETLDRNVPDITKYLDQATSEGRKRVCWNNWIAPHNAEGFYMYFGDLLVKQGKIDVAKVMYGNAKKIAEYPSWPYKALLDERLGSDLAVKAALYRDADPKNDPKFGGNAMDRNCTYCHAGSASE